LCLATEDFWLDVEEDLPVADNVDLLQDGASGKVLEDATINVVHTTGVFRHKVCWCQCPQLFQIQLFPASHVQPETAFTFDVLGHFYINAIECKTSAASFSKKLCHLTNNAFPHIQWGAKLLRCLAIFDQVRCGA
jgi:hypothetical protein